ncbi:helix-turn-helix domain-containing protein [Kamptonema cortianum]|nr:helix-turn-helix domain-containing protein [Oscillatoria laete-virens]MDK3157927.1 helix-turn-helix domain-containing protein [Kamptonema cortianum]MDL5046055.1 helix-turn-helix domain-containing protein [Oscillatoria amoena NRMC-F 0135]MDL5052762.1 helix-turn-helix domain-containing protein [Oscillatoria laete-virens NRMC-F 0139]
MSFSCPLPWQNPVTRMGVSLMHPGKLLIPRVTLLDCGYAVPFVREWNFSSVISHFWRVYYNEEPGWKISCAGKRWALTPESLLMIPEALVFDTAGCGPMNHFWLHFSVDLPSSARFKNPVRIELRPMHRELLREIRMTVNAPGARQGQRLHALIHLCGALMKSAFATLPPVKPDKTMPASLARVLHLVETHPGADLSNPILARHAGVNGDTLVKLFKEHLQTTPALHVSSSRVKTACRLLAFTDRSLEQIAEECGFPNRNYFTRVFTRQMSLPPARFRRQSLERSQPAKKTRAPL